MKVVDGSGLSHLDAVTPAFLGAVLVEAYAAPWRDDFCAASRSAASTDAREADERAGDDLPGAREDRLHQSGLGALGLRAGGRVRGAAGGGASGGGEKGCQGRAASRARRAAKRRLEADASERASPTARDREVFAFSILINGFKGANAEMKRVQDDLCRAPRCRAPRGSERAAAGTHGEAARGAAVFEGGRGMSESLLAVARELALRAGEIHLQHWRTFDPSEVKLKSRRNPVTEADLAAERWIVGELARRFPDHRVVAEEEGGRAASGAHEWIVDPLDGTVNLRTLPIFCVSIAVRRGEELLAGVVHAAALRETYEAERGAGATRNGERLHRRRTPSCARRSSPPASPTGATRSPRTTSAPSTT